MPYTRPYASGFADFPTTTTPIDSTALNTMDVGIKTANDQFQTVTTVERTALSPTVGQCVWDSDLRQLMVFMNAAGGNAWQPIGNALVCTSTTRPSTPFEGQVIRETDTNKELTYSGSAWVQTNSWSTTAGVTGVNNFIVPPIVRVRKSAPQTLTNSTDTFVTWNVEDIDTDGCFTPTSDTVTIQTAGVYQVSASMMFAGNATGARVISIGKSPTSATDGATFFCGNWVGNAGATTANTLTAAGLVSCNAGDTIKVVAWQSSGGNLDIGNASFTSMSQLSVAWIGRTS